MHGWIIIVVNLCTCANGLFIYLFIYLPHKRSKNTADNIMQLERKKKRH